MRSRFLAGCGIATVVVLGIAAGLLLSARSWVELQRADPDLRERVARKALGGPGLPDGYDLEFLLSIPLVTDVVVLGRRGADGRRQAVLAHVRTLSNRIWGEDGSALTLDVQGYRVRFVLQEALEPVDRRLGEDRLEWKGYRGSLQVAGEPVLPAAIAVMTVDCRGDPRPRRAVWATVRGEGVESASDPGAALALLSAFHLCPEP
ncbi:MAG: hypothetical protein PVF68_01680 [Acidobacteriota bacterium]